MLINAERGQYVFRVDHIRRHLAQTRVSIVLGIAFFALYGVFDYYIFPEHLPTLLALRFGSLPLFGAVALVLSRHRRFPRFAPVLLAGGIVITGAALTSMQVLTASPENYVYFAGILVLLYFCFGLLPIPFREALIAGWIAAGSHCTVVLATSAGVSAHQLAQVFIVSSVAIGGAFMSYSRERSERGEFAARHQVALQQGELNRHRQYLEERILERTRELHETNSQLSSAMEALEEREATIEDQLHERTAMLQEIHHRVGNNLQTIGSLLELELSIGRASGPESLRKMVARVRSMATVHSVMYESGDFTTIALDRVVETLVQTWRHEHLPPNSPREILVQVTDIAVPLEQAIPTAMLVNELLNIACTDGTQDSVVISMIGQTDGLVSLSVSGLRWDPRTESIECDSVLSNHLIYALTSQVGGSVGCRDESELVTVLFPVTAHAR